MTTEQAAELVRIFAGCENHLFWIAAALWAFLGLKIGRVIMGRDQ